MITISFNKGVKEVKNDQGETLYFPYMLLDGKETFFSEQGNLVFYYDREDAEKYIHD